MIRPARVFAVARRDLKVVLAGKGSWRLGLTALALLLPAGALPLPEFKTPLEIAQAAGDIPPSLADRIQHNPRFGLRMEGEAPVLVHTSRVPPPLREVLDTLPGEPTVRFDLRATEFPVPQRGLLLALLSLSLLTGPLTESLAGERSRKTLLSLLTASISRGELALGKWLAWAGVSSVMTLAVALSGRVTGAMPLGLWCLGLPLASGMAAALGLWLGRDAEDEVDGAARTLRALPVIALGLFGAAYGLNMVSPGLGAVVPLGGALLLAGGLLTGVTPVIGAVLSTAFGVGALVWGVARALDAEGDPRPSPALSELSHLGVGAAVWWLPVAGPAAWALAGNPDLGQSLSPAAGVAVGGALFGLYALVEALRRHWSLAELLNLPTEGVRSLYFPRAALVGVALSLSAAATAALPFPDNGWLYAIRLRLSAGLDPGWAGWIPAIVAVAGQELMFRGLLQRAVGPLRAGLFFVLVCSPLDPLRGAAAAAALALLAQRGGVPLALIARLAWALAPESLSIASPGGAWVALAVAVGAAALGAERPLGFLGRR
ncbi:MAG: hypothetical protein IPO67_12365 [Deltaproteobacteria bacterium]|nr:hypothetical protein [Deltaproteobacteria bacterium]MBK9367507.1 hypothetical protein [Deltaproteobacteria bacterium]MBK9645926.1 hypothetical protein [Deltaproteobacteria bacterium]